MGERGSVEAPYYSKTLQEGGGATPRYMITVDEGWRQSILCCDMYEWAADWLVEVLQARPFAPDTAP